MLEHSFEFKNDSRSKWSRLAIHKSCGCTSIRVPEHLNISDSAHADVKLQTPNHSGRLSKRIEIDWAEEDGAVVKVVCEIKMDIRSLIEIEPAKIGFGNISPKVACNVSQTL